MKKTYWIAIPIVILLAAAGFLGSRMRQDVAASSPSPTLPPTSLPTLLPTSLPSLPATLQPTTQMSMQSTQAMTTTATMTTTYPTRYIVLAWNNLGMHCYNPDFSNLAILPPYNTLIAQVIKVDEPPQIITSGVIVEYSFPDNTYSAGLQGQPDKTNFWQFEKALYGVSTAPNIGLTGKGLSGTMDLAKDGKYYIAEGIPLTDILDEDASTMTAYPFQKALITVKDANDPTMVLAQLTVVAPVSTELNCQNCHADDADATTRYPITPTGKVETNILAIHDYLNTISYTQYLADYPDLLAKTPLMDHQPVNCDWCHSSNATGAPVVGNIKSLSNAMHGHHNPTNAPDITPDTAGCYNCHPGPTTQCLRDTMSQNFSMNCTNCHGDITVVAQNSNPWLTEPKCSNSNCHGSGYDTTEALYRQSMGHGGIYCEACHDSTHAISPSGEANDSIKFIALQGHPGSLSDCIVCHAIKPADRFTHGP
jgi:hypothetical protein